VSGDRFYDDERVAARYDEEYNGLDGDIEFYSGLAREAAAKGQPVLELACGTGRVSIPIAREGIRVVGLDRSDAMLDLARRKSQGLENVSWLQGDMANFHVEERFGLVFIPYRSFLHLATVAEQKACLRCIHDHLVPGGRLALNFWNPDLVRMGLRMAEGAAASTLMAEGEGSSSGRIRWSVASYGRAEQQLDELRIDEEVSEAGAVLSRVYRRMKLRYVFRYEMEHLLALSGFEVEALYGWFDGRSFDDQSSEMVWVARKRDA
jgi:SAM-dependent methyltransferase